MPYVLKANRKNMKGHERAADIIRIRAVHRVLKWILALQGDRHYAPLKDMAG